MEPAPMDKALDRESRRRSRSRNPNQLRTILEDRFDLVFVGSTVRYGTRNHRHFQLKKNSIVVSVNIPGRKRLSSSRSEILWDGLRNKPLPGRSELKEARPNSGSLASPHSIRSTWILRRSLTPSSNNEAFWSNSTAL